MRSPKSQPSSSREAPRTRFKRVEAAALNYADIPRLADELALRESAESKAVPSRHPFDLEERTARFGEAIIRIAKQIPREPGNNRLIDQLVGCGTSVGANYCEANEAVSKKDFRHSLSRCMKEAKETRFFLRMIVASEPQLAAEARKLYREATELLLIFSSMRRK